MTKHFRSREAFIFSALLLLIVNVPGAAAQDTPAGSNNEALEPVAIDEDGPVDSVALRPDASEEIITLPHNDAGDYKMPPAICLDPVQAINEHDFLAALSTAFESAGLTSSLANAVASQQKLTILAPTNQAFANLVSELGLESDQVLNDDEFIHNILQLHLIPETLEKDELKDGQELQTFNIGGVLTVSRPYERDSSSITLSLNGMESTAKFLNIDLNINVCEGISIIAIDSVLRPTGMPAMATLPSRLAAPAVTSPFMMGGRLFSSPMARAQDGEDTAPASSTRSAAAPGGLFGGMAAPGTSGSAFPAFFGAPSSDTAATAPFTFPGAATGSAFSAPGSMAGAEPFTFPGAAGAEPFTFPGAAGAEPFAFPGMTGTGGAGGFTFPTFGGASGATTGDAAAAPGAAAGFPSFLSGGAAAPGAAAGFPSFLSGGAGTGTTGTGGLPGFDLAAFSFPGASGTAGADSAAGATAAGFPSFPGFPSGMTVPGAATGTGTAGTAGSAFTIPGFPGFPGATTGGLPGFDAAAGAAAAGGIPGVPAGGAGGFMGFPAGLSFPGPPMGAGAVGGAAAMPLAPVGN